MNKEETINDIKSYYYVITSQLDNLELSRYLMKIPTTYFATFPYVEHYKQLQSQLATYKQKEDKLREYITSYESISILQGLNDTIKNKDLDEKTMIEMTNRYLEVHDKLLQILNESE